MNPTEIADALDQIARAPFDAATFGFSFAEATDNAVAAVSKLRSGATNKSDQPNGVLHGTRFHYAPALPQMQSQTVPARRVMQAKVPRAEKGRTMSKLAIPPHALACLAMALRRPLGRPVQRQPAHHPPCQQAGHDPQHSGHPVVLHQALRIALD